MGKRRSGGFDVTLGAGGVILMVVCCWAVPTLLAGGVLGAIGGFLGNPFVITAGIAVACGGLAAASCVDAAVARNVPVGSDKDRGFER